MCAIKNEKVRKRGEKKNERNAIAKYEIISNSLASMHDA